MEEIAKEQGHFFVEGNTQKKIDEYYNLISENKEGQVKSYDTNDAYVVSGVIKGPGWNLVTIYPKENMQSVAVETASFVGFMGLVSLIIELLILNHVLKKYVSSPITKLLNATNRFASGDMNTRVDLKNDDEIGSLADAFNDMAQKVKQRDELLSKQAHELEDLVNERTNELDQQRAKAYQAAKMATLGEMAGGIAHEINNPLAVIAAYAEKLKRRLPYTEENQDQLKQGLDTIERTVERISKIVKGMKSFSRSADSDPMKVVSLKSIIDETLVLCEEKVKSNQVKLTVDEIPQYNIFCRDVQIIQSFLNLIQNAIDAIAQSEQRVIEVQFETIENKVRIIVEDSGPGVPKELVEKIMNPFFTTKEVGKGTGLGLFISLGLVESNHGRLYLDTKSAKTRFVIELPFT
jgi:C4-dicarboxylate-specific signal transduction histidine kinase